MEEHVVRLFSLQQLAFAEKQRLHKEVEGRMLTVLIHEGKYYAFDSHCFHMGGPLGAAGDIEDLGDYTVISCPWHHRKIDLVTGKQIDKDLSGQVSASAKTMQRVYQASIDGEGWLWVDLNLRSEEAHVPSDAYNFCSNQTCGYGLGHRAMENSECIPPLTPYAGINRRPMSPSPLKTPGALQTVAFKNVDHFLHYLLKKCN